MTQPFHTFSIYIENTDSFSYIVPRLLLPGTTFELIVA